MSIQLRNPRPLVARRPAARLRTAITASVLALAAAGCGGSDSTTGPDDPGGGGPTLPNGSMSARINGAPWRASFLVQAQITGNKTGEFTTLVVTGADTVGSGVMRARQIVITISRRAAQSAGTYPIGATNGGGTFVSLANFVHGASSWTSPMKFDNAAGSGTINITTLTDSRIAGTFSYTADPAPSNPTGEQGTLSVTEGKFDIKLTTTQLGLRAP